MRRRPDRQRVVEDAGPRPIPGRCAPHPARVCHIVALAAVLVGCGDGESVLTRTASVDRVLDVVTASAGEDAGPDGDDVVDPADGDVVPDSLPTDDGAADSVLTDAVSDTAVADGSGDAAIGDASDGDVGPGDVGAGETAGDDASAGPSCQVGATIGSCRHLSACDAGEAPIEGFCAGGPQIRCCLPGAWDGCSVATAPGACVGVATCADGFATTAGLCPGPSGVRCCATIGGGTSCAPSDLPTPNAGLGEEPGAPGCPDAMVGVTAALCIDRFEAALVRADAPAITLSPYHPPGTTPARAVSLRWAVPQGNITGEQAGAACAAAGKRLCSGEEWLRACRGPSGWAYPYGATREPGRCNDARPVHPAVERFGTDAAWIWSELADPCIAQLAAGLALTGEHPGCVSAEGAYDLMGNLHEWVADAAGTFRGGFYVDTRINGEGCLYATTAHNVQHHDYSTGFRCCADRTAQ